MRLGNSVLGWSKELYSVECVAVIAIDGLRDFSLNRKALLLQKITAHLHSSLAKLFLHNSMT